MREVVQMPIFPLSILPLPKEIVPLHIFEPRYRELLEDLEAGDGKFGLLYSGENNRYNMGTILKLDRVIKRHPTGESDIVCRAEDVFLLLDYFRKHPGKMYPGGNIHMLDFDDFEINKEFDQIFREYMDAKKQTDLGSPLMIHDVANELDMDIQDRLRYLRLLKPEKREKFLKERVRFRKHVLNQESITRNFYIYN
jgi:Lon protease-like protein